MKKVQGGLDNKDIQGADRDKLEHAKTLLNQQLGGSSEIRDLNSRLVSLNSTLNEGFKGDFTNLIKSADTAAEALEKLAKSTELSEGFKNNLSQLSQLTGKNSSIQSLQGEQGQLDSQKALIQAKNKKQDSILDESDLLVVFWGRQPIELQGY